MKRTTIKLTGSLAGLSALIAAGALIGQSSQGLLARTDASGDLVHDFYGVRTASQTDTNGSSGLSVTVNGHAIAVPEHGSVTTTVPDPNQPEGNSQVQVTVNNDTTPDSHSAQPGSPDVHVTTNSSSTTSVNASSHTVNNSGNQNSGFFSNTFTQNGKVISHNQQNF